MNHLNYDLEYWINEKDGQYNYEFKMTGKPIPIESNPSSLKISFNFSYNEKWYSTSTWFRLEIKNKTSWERIEHRSDIWINKDYQYEIFVEESDISRFLNIDPVTNQYTNLDIRITAYLEGILKLDYLSVDISTDTDNIDNSIFWDDDNIRDYSDLIKISDNGLDDDDCW
ncbi:MAG: hypothetical protein ACTSWX_14770, partial [Promethearchaeota archaeon]